MTDIPPGVEVPPAIVSNELGPQCEDCTHYRDEHEVGEEHCNHTMFYFPLSKDEEFYEKQGMAVARSRQICNCKKFVSVEK